MRTLINILLFSIALSVSSCPSGKTYAKFTKQCYNYGSEESYEIWSGSVLLETSPTFEDNAIRVIEYCLDATTNNQYTVKLKDSYGDSWTNGAYLLIEGIDGNAVFKNYLTTALTDVYTVSLYYGANKNDSWKMTSSTITGTWTEHDYNDNTWSQVTLGSVTSQVSGTQYFRKTFEGLTNMSAYELGMNYKYGLIAYINGVEIYRDNMPSGTPSPSMNASGSYTSLEYRSIMRPGSEVGNSQSVVAVELHFTASSSQTNVDFNAFLALLAPSDPTTSCSIYPYETTITNSYSSTEAPQLFDFFRTTVYTIPTADLPVSFSFAFKGARPYINGMNFYPYTASTSVINTFNFEGSFAVVGPWTSVVTVNNYDFSSKITKHFSGYFNAGLYSNYRFKAVSSPDSTATTTNLYELQPLVCNMVIPTSIEFSSSTYTAFAKYEEVNIKPIITEFVNCQIHPTPLEGLTFDSATCTLSGKVSTVTSVTYTVSSTVNEQTYTGSFTVTFTDCEGTMVSILRTYKTYATREGFSVVDASNQEVVFNMPVNSNQVNSVDVEYFLCLTRDKYYITTDSLTTFWIHLSFIYVKGLFDENSYEVILRAKFDSILGLPTTYNFNINYHVKNNESWSYIMGSVPTNWYNTEMTSWTQTASAGSFPSSMNQIQLYKKQFNINTVQDMGGVVITLRYQYGVLIYLNGHEAFRLGVTGDLSTESFSSTYRNEIAWRQISLPTRTISVDGTPSVDYITTGTNTIAIALVATQNTLTNSTFDCAIRLMGDQSNSRVWDVTPFTSGMTGHTTYMQNFYYTLYLTSTACNDNYWQIQFNNDRHEWISSVTVKLHYTQGTMQPRRFVLKAKNADTDWITLRSVTDMTWSLVGQRNRIWIPNNKAYNIYRFENFGTGDSSSCTWKFGMIDLLSDSVVTTIPDLSYEDTTIYKDIEMAELYPNSNYYMDFAVTPALPEGIILDPNSGTISGSASTLMSSTIYTITAKKFTGEEKSTTLRLTVETCHSGKSLITLVARMDTTPITASFSLFQGKGTSGTAIKQNHGFSAAASLNYIDLCLVHGIYTLRLEDTNEAGWTVPAGYYLSVDVGEMKFEMGQVYSGGSSPVAVTTLFSSFLPFQVEYDDWKVYKETSAVATNWNTLDFDDSTWTTTKAAAIGTSEAVTIYIRRDITLEDSSNYHVLNVRIRYAGGVVAYFNGRKVARFNLVENFDADTESIEIHDSTLFSKFHIILATVGVVTGKNVIAFEVHRPKEQSSSETIVFDATGVFGVNDCSIGVDSVINVSGSTFTSIESLENFFDFTPVTYGSLENTIGSHLQWTVENLEGTKFNSFAMESVSERTSLGFSIYGRSIASEDPDVSDYTSIFEAVDLSTPEMSRVAWSVPAGIAGFRQFRWEIDVPASDAVETSAYILQYCKTSGEGYCPAVGDYPAVGEGQISPAPCGAGFRGYSYRECVSGQLGEIKTDKCEYKVPANLVYENERVTMVQDTQITVGAPTYENIITRFYLSEGMTLPAGLILDEKTGSITGVPTEQMDFRSYTIYGENPKGVTSVVLGIMVRKGECKAFGNFPKTQVGEVGTYECSLNGNFIGVLSRECVLGAVDGEWQPTSGICISITTIVFIVLIIIVVVVVLVYFLIRATKKRKAVGGVKGKKNTTPTKVEKKRTTANVKV